MRERWKIVKAFDGTFDNYAVSSAGRVRNLNTGRLLKPQTSVRRGGYLFVNLCANGTRKNINIHSLVAEAFLGERPCGMVAHHKDHDRTNPRLENLEYVTLAENAAVRKIVRKAA